ncbi:Protein RnfH [Candidatus Kinetoplastibacterium sorsogonicusi]|uniref:Protein RnfH n=1 Tax=Candidatus Kinetoplastidibacterium kentomonadis TaxID=1576550 RepID=A0A3Q8ERJ6_9PROT|nr:RnfH family protein [Candidatus Kinetoplastibacterium sorsogonicusi]AWD32439.1 Protein RnfH [Candidatus Kinetoplastibacterium sorsogonicusi]
MNISKKITVEIFYSHNKNHLWKQVLLLPNNTNISEALLMSDFNIYFPNINPIENGISIFGKIQSKDYILENNDRIDICRPLIFDPHLLRSKIRKFKK